MNPSSKHLTLLEIISPATYCKIVFFRGAVLFFANRIFKQHEFFIVEYTFIWSSSFFFFNMERILYHEKCDHKKCKKHLNTEIANWRLHFTYGLLFGSNSTRAQQGDACVQESDWEYRSFRNTGAWQLTATQTTIPVILTHPLTS